MPKINEKIFLVAGGTGGHLFPAIAVAQKDGKNEYIFIIDDRVENILKKFNFNYFIVSSSSFEKKLFRLPLIFIKIIMGFFKSLYLINKIKPKLIVGFGGYTSIPTILAAKFFNIKTLIHEQNALMGRTNRILSRLCNNTAISFKTTKFARKDSFFTGIPLRSFNKKKNTKKKKKNFNCRWQPGSKNFFKYYTKNSLQYSSKYKKKNSYYSTSKK